MRTVKQVTDFALAVLSAVFAAGGAYAAVRVELRFVWREIDRLTSMIDPTYFPTRHRK